MEKKYVKRVLIICIISMIMFNFIFSNVSIASEAMIDSATQKMGGNTSEIKKEEETAKSILGNALTIVDGIAGVYLNLIKVPLVLLVTAFQYLGTVLGESAGTLDDSGMTVFNMITPREILFNRLAITDVNFFNISSFGTLNNQKSLANDNPIKALRESIANWYMAIRMICIIILLCVLIYIGIRMVLSTSSEKKAEYKKMFYNWFVSLAMVFLLHYIIILILNVNSAIVNMLDGVIKNSLEGEGKFITNYMNVLVLKSIFNVATTGSAYAVIYTCIVIAIFVLLVMYVKRMITIAFLILISPIITITYSIDKVGDGKAQAFSDWFKEFMHNVLIQPFHCLIYVAFVSIAINNLQSSGTIAAGAISIMLMFFMLQSEKIIKKIFGLDSESTGNALATATTLMALNKYLDPGAKKVASAASNAYSTYKSSKGEAKPKNDSRVAESNIKESEEKKEDKNTEEQEKKSYDLNRKLTEGTGEYEDYQQLRESENETKERKINEANLASADDYDELMGNTLPRNKVMGILNKGENKNETSIKENNQKNEEKQESKESNQNSDESSEKMTNESFMSKVGKHLIPGKKEFGIANGIIGATMAGMAGKDLSTVIGSYMVGERAGEYVVQKTDDLYEEKKYELQKLLSDMDIKEKEKKLSETFSNKKEHKNYNKNADIQSARNYLGMNEEQVKNIQNKSEQQYVQALHAMRDAYNKSNYNDEDPNEKVINTMEKIIEQKVKSEE